MALPPAARRDTLVAGLVLALGLVLFPRALLRGELFFERDLHVDWYPRIASLARCLASGSWPVWDPSIGFGLPLLADPGAQVMYPGTWLAMLLPVSASYTVFVLLHLLLTAAGTARLARAMGAGRIGAPAAALLWVASGPLQSSLNLWHHFAGVSWMPWVLLGMSRLVDGPGFTRGVSLAAVLSLQVLAGSADACAMTLALGAIWVLVRLASERGGRRRATRTGVALAGALLLSVGLTAVVWWPAADVLSRSQRSDLPADVRTAWSVPPAGLLRLLIPLDPGRVRPEAEGWPLLYDGARPPFLHSLYFGPVMLALSGAALAWRRARGRAALLLAGAGGALAMAMGPHGPLYPVLVAIVPPLRIFRYPSKALFVVAFLLALAAGLGVAAIRRGRTGGLSALAGLVLVGSLAAAFVGPRYGAVEIPLFAVALAVAAAAVAVLTARELLAPGLAGVVLAALAVADLLGAHVGLNPTALPSLLVDPPPLVAHVDRSEGRRLYVYDYHSLPGTSQRWLGRPHPYSYLTPPAGWDSRVFVMVALRLYLLPPSAGFYGIEGSYDVDLRGLYPRELDDLVRFLRQVEGQPAHAKLLRAGAVGTVASLHDGAFGEPAATLASLFPEPIRVWRVPGALPRAWVVGCARHADRASAFEAFLEPAFDPAGEVVLPGEVAAGARCGPAGTTRVLMWRPDRVRLEIEADRAGYVVLADAYDPGWRVSVDDGPATLLRANVGFRAVPVPAGRHVVEMVYRPRAVTLGLGLTLVALALLVVGVGARVLALRRGRGGA